MLLLASHGSVYCGYLISLTQLHGNLQVRREKEEDEQCIAFEARKGAALFNFKPWSFDIFHCCNGYYMVILPGQFICEEEFEGWLPRMTFEKYSSLFFSFGTWEKKRIFTHSQQKIYKLSVIRSVWKVFEDPRENTDLVTVKSSWRGVDQRASSCMQFSWVPFWIQDPETWAGCKTTWL